MADMQVTAGADEATVTLDQFVTELTLYVPDDQAGSVRILPIGAGIPAAWTKYAVLDPGMGVPIRASKITGFKHQRTGGVDVTLRYYPTQLIY